MAVVEKKVETAAEVKMTTVYLKSFIAGGISGMCSKTSVAPLGRIKILFQAHSNHYNHYGVFSGLKAIVQNEGVIGLYKGNGAHMVRIFPYAACQFLSFEIYKKFLTQKFGDSHALKFFAGSSAGVTAVMATYPLDLVRTRLAFQVTGEQMYSGIYNSFSCILKTEGGFRALYKGMSPALLATIPYVGLSFYIFEKLKHFCLKHFPNVTGREHTDSIGVVLTVPAKLLCGGFAGAIAQTFSYPLEVARRKMQLSMMKPETHRFGKSLVTTLVLTYYENGIVKGLYRGMTTNYLRAVPMVAVSFATYEITKQLLGLDTGIES